MVRPRFNPAASYTAARALTYNGVQYAAGDPFDASGIAPYKLNTLYGSRAINMVVGDAATGPVGMKELGGGYYEITAPWFDEPEKVRGKKKAEKRRDELVDAGEPLDHHGVSVNESGGGWYSVEAEWLDEGENVQGLDEAKARAAQLRAAGPPPEHYALVVVAPAEADAPEGPWIVDAPWLAGVEEHGSQDEAEARAQLIREAGPPEDGYDAEAIAKAREERASADATAREEAVARQVEAGRREAYVSSFTLTSVTTGEGDDAVTVHKIEGPGLEAPEEFGDQAEAEARLNEIREAGPPEGWEPATE